MVSKRLANLRANSAQSTLEYLLVLVIIIAIIIAASRTIIRPAVDESLTKLGDAIKNSADHF